VFKIVHVKSGKGLAWKEIAILGDDKEKLKEEATIGMKVDSEFVAPLLDNFEEEAEGIFYLVEELYEEGTLGKEFGELKKSGKEISKEVYLSVTVLLYTLIMSQFFLIFTSV
jgi:hypothetical protein